MNFISVESLSLLNDLPKGVTLTSLSDMLVISLNEGEELYNGETIDVQNIPDEEHDILDNIDNDVEINSSTKHVILHNSQNKLRKICWRWGRCWKGISWWKHPSDRNGENRRTHAFFLQATHLQASLGWNWQKTKQTLTP